MKPISLCLALGAAHLAVGAPLPESSQPHELTSVEREAVPRTATELLPNFAAWERSTDRQHKVSTSRTITEQPVPEADRPAVDSEEDGSLFYPLLGPESDDGGFLTVIGGGERSGLWPCVGGLEEEGGQGDILIYGFVLMLVLFVAVVEMRESRRFAFWCTRKYGLRHRLNVLWPSKTLSLREFLAEEREGDVETDRWERGETEKILAIIRS